jgi:hypothetical protein
MDVSREGKKRAFLVARVIIPHTGALPVFAAKFRWQSPSKSSQICRISSIYSFATL